MDETLKKIVDDNGRMIKPSKSLFVPRPETYVDEIVKAWPPEKQDLFYRVLLAIEKELEDVPTPQRDMMGIAYVVAQDFLKLSREDIKKFTLAEREMFEWVLKIYESNFNKPLANSKARVQQSSFLSTLNALMATKQENPNLEMKAQFKPGGLLMPKKRPENEEIGEPVVDLSIDEQKALLLKKLRELSAATAEPKQQSRDDDLGIVL